MGIWEELRREEFWNWLPKTGGEFFDACFDMAPETIAPGERRQSHGRVGYLLSGSAVLTAEGAARDAEKGTLFGAKDSRTALETELCARTPCTVFWMDGAILRSVCYSACWFHARFCKEAEAYFRKMGRGSGAP